MRILQLNTLLTGGGTDDQCVKLSAGLHRAELTYAWRDLATGIFGDPGVWECRWRTRATKVDQATLHRRGGLADPASSDPGWCMPTTGATTGRAILASASFWNAAASRPEPAPGQESGLGRGVGSMLGLCDSPVGLFAVCRQGPSRGGPRPGPRRRRVLASADAWQSAQRSG